MITDKTYFGIDNTRKQFVDLGMEVLDFLREPADECIVDEAEIRQQVVAHENWAFLQETTLTLVQCLLDLSPSLHHSLGFTIGSSDNQLCIDNCGEGNATKGVDDKTKAGLLYDSPLSLGLLSLKELLLFSIHLGDLHEDTSL